MKKFTIIKTGYTAGIYGCSGEYFTCVYVNDNEMGRFHFEGMYGTDERVGYLMKELGYKEMYTGCSYGKLTRKDIPKHKYMGEYEAIAYIKNDFKEAI